MKKYKLFGLSLLEVVIAISILFVVGTILVLVMGLGLNQLNRAKALNIATSLAQQKMEEAIGTAPNKLTSLTGTFPAPNDQYRYVVAYTPSFQGYDSLQQVLVNVFGASGSLPEKLGIKVAYAQTLPAGGGNLISSTMYSVGGYSYAWTGHLDKSNNTLYLKVNPSDYNANNILTLRLNTGFNPGGLTFSGGYVPGSQSSVSGPIFRIYFLDKSITPPNICFLSFYDIDFPTVTAIPRVCAKISGPSVSFNWGDTIDLTSWDSSVLCDSLSTFFP